MMYWKHTNGVMEVITGPMFSGKSEELIKRVNILGYAKINTLVFKPEIDSRWDKDKITSRSGKKIKTKSIKKSSEIIKYLKKAKTHYDAIAIDEIQFFDEGIIDVINELIDDYKIKRVIVSGLDKDFYGKPFSIMAQVLAMSDIVDKQYAICRKCGKAATMSFKLTDNDEILEIGDKIYEPRCRSCHREGLKKNGNNAK